MSPRRTASPALRLMKLRPLGRRHRRLAQLALGLEGEDVWREEVHRAVAFGLADLVPRPPPASRSRMYRTCRASRASAPIELVLLELRARLVGRADATRADGTHTRRCARGGAPARRLGVLLAEVHLAAAVGVRRARVAGLALVAADAQFGEVLGQPVLEGLAPPPPSSAPSRCRHCRPSAPAPVDFFAFAFFAAIGASAREATGRTAGALWMTYASQTAPSSATSTALIAASSSNIRSAEPRALDRGCSVISRVRACTVYHALDFLRTLELHMQCAVHFLEAASAVSILATSRDTSSALLGPSRDHRSLLCASPRCATRGGGGGSRRGRGRGSSACGTS